MNKNVFLFLFAIYLLLVGYPAFTQYQIRQVGAVPLHGQWSFALDPLDVGEKNGWYRSDFEVAHFGDKVSVPHCFSADPRYLFYTGTSWYKRNFSWSITPGKRVLLHFDAAYYQTKVWLNNKKVGEHEGGYTPFYFDITEMLQSGDNTITISVNNNTWRLGTIPGAKDNGKPNAPFMGWINYGGLVRPVYLIEKPEVYIERVKIEAEPNLQKKTAMIRVKAFIKNVSGQATASVVNLRVTQNNKPVYLRWKIQDSSFVSGATVALLAEAQMKAADVKLWNIDDPNLYQLKICISGDTLTDNFGIRSIEIKSSQFLINGVAVKMAGANRVIDYPGMGSLEPDSLIEKDFRLMKEAGMILHRLTHYTPSEYFYNLADKYGMLIITEAGNWQLTPKQMNNDNVRDKFKKQFVEMMQRDWNHPSVFAYSVGNEYLSNTPEGQSWTKDMIAFGRSQDATRLYTFATMMLNSPQKSPIEEASQYCDFVCTNTYSNHAKVLDNIHRLYPNKPIFISEWGRRADDKGEAEQAQHIRDVVKVIRERPYVFGASWWSYNDYQSRYMGTNSNGYRPWGLVDGYRQPRAAYQAYREEMSPFKVRHLSRTTVRITARRDFPAYPTSRFKIKTNEGIESIISSLKPGESTDIRLEGNVNRIQIITPTGFIIYNGSVQ